MEEAIHSMPELSADDILPLLRSLPSWGPLTTIVFASGCVFEFKGSFPPGEAAAGFYNLEGPVPGFHGHLRLEALSRVRFQERPHRGRESRALVFLSPAGKTVFKVFLGRDEQGDIRADQRERFNALRARAANAPSSVSVEENSV